MSSPDRDVCWKVALVDSIFSKHSLRSSSALVHLPDPATNQRRHYIIVAGGKHIVEVQSLPADFSSFFVGRHVVKDGSLYVLNHVDPLFFYLAAQSLQQDDGTNQSSWQPLDQVLAPLPKEVQISIEESQMAHVCQTLSNEQTDNVTYLKFSKERSLQWLAQKQDRVYQCLLRQDQACKQNAKARANATKNRGGSVSSSFNMLEDDTRGQHESSRSSSTTDSASSAVLLADTTPLKHESIQVVCSYLSAEWKNAFLRSLNLDEESVFGLTPKGNASQTGIGATTTNSSTPVVVDDTPAKSKEIPRSQTVGNKRLAKISTKGMKSLGSFFGAPAGGGKSKKSKTQ